jgi:hypothetical protein
MLGQAYITSWQDMTPLMLSPLIILSNTCPHLHPCWLLLGYRYMRRDMLTISAHKRKHRILDNICCTWFLARTVYAGLEHSKQCCSGGAHYLAHSNPGKPAGVGCGAGGAASRRPFTQNMPCYPVPPTKFCHCCCPTEPTPKCSWHRPALHAAFWHLITTDCKN